MHSKNLKKKLLNFWLNIICYRFGATYVGTKQTGPNEAYPILLGDIDPSGNMNANILHQLTDRIKVKLACQVLEFFYYSNLINPLDFQTIFIIFLLIQ